MSSWPGWHMSSTVRAGRQAGEHGREIGLVEPAAEVEAYEIVAAPQALSAATRRRRGRAPSAPRRAARAAGCAACSRARARPDSGRRGSPCSAASSATMRRDAGQHVHVLVPVDVADGDAGVPHAAQLRAELEANFGQRDPAAQPPCRAAASSAAGKRPSGSTRLAAAAAPTSGRCSVSTRWMPTASPGRLRASATACSNAGARRHDRCRRHDAAVVGLDDAAIHGFGDSEVVGVDDELRRRAHRRPANAQCFMPR